MKVIMGLEIERLRMRGIQQITKVSRNYIFTESQSQKKARISPGHIIFTGVFVD